MKQTEFTIAELQEMYEEYLLTMLNSTNGISKKDLMTDQDVAELFGVSVKTLDTYRRNG
ncbi:helix-turn-helix domain-containing protein [Empedobacter falsenii]